jgi:hypothetical protein
MSDSRTLETALKILPVIGACVTFAWGVWVWKDNADEERAAAASETERYADSRRIEATRPFLELQLKLYTEAALVTGKIATASGTQQDVDRFWQLYTGELALVEDPEVAKAMIAYGEALKANKQGSLGGLAIALAHRMRESLARSWGTDAWQMRAATPAP